MSTNRFLSHAGAEFPVVCGAMYPCSNPELVAAVSEAGGIGIVQPLTLVYANKYEFRKGLEKIRSLTKKPIGLNVLTEKSLSRVYRKRMEGYVDVALEHGVRFFVTALGNPAWVVERVRPFGGIVYHDVVDRKWAEKALEGGVHGLLCVNDRAGGHAGYRSPAQRSGTPSGPRSSTSCAGERYPAWPPARSLTQRRPSTPPSSAFSAHFRSTTSW